MSKKVITYYYILSWLFSAGGMHIISAIYVSFLMEKGLNELQVNIVNACFFATLFCCEIPTGAFADIFGRKKSFVVACGLVSISMIVYGSSHSFWQFICAEVIAAIGMTFRSGAFQSWLVDSLKHHNYDGPLEKIFAKESMINQAGAGVGAVLGSHLASVNMTLPWFVGGSIMAMVAVIAYLIMKEDYHIHRKLSFSNGLRSMKNVAKASMHYGVKDKAVRFILIITFIQILALQPLNMYWQPYFKSHGVAKINFGYIYVGIMLAVGIGAFIASRTTIREKEKRLILGAQIFVGCFIIITALVSRLPTILVCFLLHEVGRGFWVPIKDSFLHKRIPSDERATIISFCAIAPHIGGVIGLISSGIIAQLFSISTAWICSGTIMIMGALLVSKNGRIHS